MQAHAPSPFTHLPGTFGGVLRQHWPLYLMEGAELGIFMLSACAFTILLFYPASPAAQHISSPWLRRALMGLSMGMTAFFIIRCPMGVRSGAHFNPAITLTYLRLHKIDPADAVGYVVGQFLGGAAGVAIAALLFPTSIAAPSVRYAVTVPGIGGPPAAFVAELFMATLLMGVVLWTSNHPRLQAYTSYLVAILITLYVLFFAPVSGFSINPARTTASAIFANLFSSIWIYFTAPLIGMFLAAQVYLRRYGQHRIYCAKLHHDSRYPCPFHCRHAQLQQKIESKP
jgi:aquaporin Z